MRTPLPRDVHSRTIRDRCGYCSLAYSSTDKNMSLILPESEHYLRLIDDRHVSVNTVLQEGLIAEEYS